MFVNLGPHPPRLWPEDVEVLHEIWLDLSGPQDLGSSLHHRDLVGVALRKLRDELKTRQRPDLIEEIRKEGQQEHGREPFENT